MNRIRDSKKRMRAARTIRDTINKMLVEGFNPFQRERGNQTINAASEKYQSEHISMKRPRTRSSVKSALKLLKDKFGKSNMDEVTGSEIKSYLVSLSQSRKWENKTYNGTLAYWKAFFTYFKNQDPPLLEKSPCDSIKYLKVYPTDRNRPPTEEEFSVIVNHLYEHEKELFLFTMIVYYQAYRVTETGLLQRWKFEFKTEHPFIRIAAKDQKDNEDSTQYVSPHLLPFLYEMEIDQLPGEYFLFSTNLKPGKQFVKKIKDRVEARWREVVKLQLGIPVNLYSMKHKQATELAESVSTKDISSFLRHSNEETTRQYIKKYKAVVPYSFFSHQRPLPLKPRESPPTKIVKIK